MDHRFYCDVCHKNCQNQPNYDSHVEGRERYKKLVAANPYVPERDAEQAYFNSDYDEPRARALAIRPPQPAQPARQPQPAQHVRFKATERRRAAPPSSPPAPPTPAIQPRQRPLPMQAQPRQATSQQAQPKPTQPAQHQPAPQPAQPIKYNFLYPSTIRPSSQPVQQAQL